MQQSNEILAIPKDAVIPVKIGTGYLLRLQKLLVHLIADKSKEELKDLEERLKDNTIEEDSWMYHFQTIRDFVSYVEQTAVDEKLTVVKNIDDLSQSDPSAN